MKKLFLLSALLFVVLPTRAADRVTTDLESSLKAEAAHVIARDDGGCAIQARVRITQSDGGVRREDSEEVELNGANRTACLDVVTRSLAAYKIGRF